MKTNILSSSLLLVMIFWSNNEISAQKQMEIQGDPNSSDTVAVIKVNSTAFGTDVMGLATYSEPTIGRGIGGNFYGGLTGLIGASNLGTGLFGRSNSGVGVYGTSQNSVGAFFKGGDGRDIMLGGSSYGNGSGADEGVISTQSSLPSSDLWLVSNDAVVIELDANNDEAGSLEIKNGGDTTVASIDESGTLKMSGKLQSTPTGATNLLPICYGYIDGDGNIINGSDNYSVTLSSSGYEYIIDIGGHNFVEAKYTVIVFPRRSDQDFNAAWSWKALAGKLRIVSNQFRTSGPLAGIELRQEFSFIVYKP